MYVLVVIWTIAPFDNYAVLYNSETECERAAAVLQQGNTLSDGTYRPIVHATCLPLREAGGAFRPGRLVELGLKAKEGGP